MEVESQTAKYYIMLHKRWIGLAEDDPKKERLADKMDTVWDKLSEEEIVQLNRYYRSGGE